MKLKEICKKYGYEYDAQHTDRLKEKIKKDYILEENLLIPRDYIIRPLTNEEKTMSDNNGKTRKILSRSGIRFDEANKKGCVYCIKLDNKVYVGQTYNLVRRLQQHISNKTYQYTRHGKHYEYPSATYNIINNNESIVKVLEYCDERILRLEKEREWTEYYMKLGFDVINDETVLYKKDKHETKTIKVSIANYDLAVELLRKNNLI